MTVTVADRSDPDLYFSNWIGSHFVTVRELQTGPKSPLSARDAPKDQKKSCTNSQTHALVCEPTQIRTPP